MATWRAKHLRLRLNRRIGVTITVRRFRLARKPTKTKQYIFNTPGRIRQVAIRVERKRRIHRTQPLILTHAAAVACIVMGMGGVVYSTAQLTRAPALEPSHTFQVPAKTISVRATPKAYTLPRATPTHISIASQQIDVDLTPVGLADDGSIELPPVLDWMAGWYKLSPTPGELGPAVIVGHVDSYEGTSVFWNLRYVQPGDSIDIGREDGSIAHFRVTQLAEYDQSNFPTQQVYGNTTDSELRVITCGGTFDETTHAYSQNTVVYATLVP